MAIFILNLQNNDGNTRKKEVEADSCLKAVNNTLDGEWVLMSNSEIPRGMYRSGTYSVENGYVTVKKPNNIFDWLKKV